MKKYIIVKVSFQQRKSVSRRKILRMCITGEKEPSLTLITSYTIMSILSPVKEYDG